MTEPVADPTAAEQPTYVTPAELAKREKALQARLDKALQDFDAKVSPVLQKLQETAPAPVVPAPGVQESPEYKGLQKRLSDMEQKAAQAEENAAAERRAGAETKMRQALGDALSAAGVDAKHLRHAVGFLVDVERRVKLADGAIVYQDGNDALDLATGLKAWLATDDAKLYLAPRGIVGSGDKPGARLASKPNGAPTREQLAMGLQQALTGNQVYIG